MAMGVTTYLQTAATLELSTGFLLGLEPDTRQHVTGITGWHSGAGMKRTKTERMAGHGNFSERGYKDERLVSVSGYFHGNSRAEAAAYTDMINSFLADGLEGVLTVTDPDLGVRHANVYLDGTPEVTWNGGLGVAFTVDMAAPDPRKYGQPTLVQTGVPEPGGALVYDLFTGDSPGILDFGPAGSDGIAQVTNIGTADTPTLLRIQGPTVSGFTITESGTGNRLVYTAGVPEGSTLELDSADGSVFLDGTADRSVYLSVREWTRIPPGGTASFLYEAPTGPTSTLTVEASPAWW